MKIDSYRFGQIVIDGKKYCHDVMIYPDRVGSWWPEEGHKVCLQDLEEALGKMPEALIIGTGASELMKVPPEVQEHIASQKIELIVKPTAAACQIYNENFPYRKIIAALHLTC
jgi:hypothetical protein